MNASENSDPLTETDDVSWVHYLRRENKELKNIKCSCSLTLYSDHLALWISVLRPTGHSNFQCATQFDSVLKITPCSSHSTQLSQRQGQPKLRNTSQHQLKENNNYEKKNNQAKIFQIRTNQQHFRCMVEQDLMWLKYDLRAFFFIIYLSKRKERL